MNDLYSLSSLFLGCFIFTLVFLIYKGKHEKFFLFFLQKSNFLRVVFL